MRSKIILAALAATAAFASPAMAQTSASDTALARGTVLRPLTLVKVAGQDLDFGTVLTTALPGTVTMDADGGGRSFTGGVTLLGLVTGQRALFAGVGVDGQTVDIHLDPPASGVLDHTNGVDTVAISSMTLDSNGVGDAFDRTVTINDVNGAFLVGVGGTFAIAANQEPGVYSATFSVTVDY